MGGVAGGCGAELDEVGLVFLVAGGYEAVDLGGCVRRVLGGRRRLLASPFSFTFSIVLLAGDSVHGRGYDRTFISVRRVPLRQSCLALSVLNQNE